MLVHIDKNGNCIFKMSSASDLYFFDFDDAIMKTIVYYLKYWGIPLELQHKIMEYVSQAVCSHCHVKCLIQYKIPSVCTLQCSRCFLRHLDDLKHNFLLAGIIKNQTFVVERLFQ